MLNTKNPGSNVNCGSGIDRTHRSEGDDPDAWAQYGEELIEQVMTRTDFDDPDLGVVLLSIKSGARGREQHLHWWIGALGNLVQPDGTMTPARQSLSEGKHASTLYAEVFGTHRGMSQIIENTAAFGKEFRESRTPKGFNVLSRAVRSSKPGVVFARAAAIEEVDPLLDHDSRLLVGLRPKDRKAVPQQQAL